jgi:hypothetical protein
MKPSKHTTNPLDATEAHPIPWPEILAPGIAVRRIPRELLILKMIMIILAILAYLLGIASNIATVVMAFSSEIIPESWMRLWSWLWTKVILG